MLAADQLRAAIATNPLIQSRGPSLDARLLFEGSNQTRISIISFIGLRHFARAELAMTDTVLSNWFAT
jgi:hypothetical protein